MVRATRNDAKALGSIQLFSGLRHAELLSIGDAARVCHLENAAVLFQQGAPATGLYVVLQGRLKITQVSVDGQELLLRFVGPGQMLGGPALLADASYPVTAQVTEPSCVLCWSSDAMRQFFLCYPQLAQNALGLMADRIVELQDRCRELTTEHVDRRVARALLRLAQQTGRNVEEGILLAMKLSRQDLAELTGTTLFTTSRILSRWTQEGLVRAGRRSVILRRPHALRCIAEDLPFPAAREGCRPGDEG